ncbi:MAG: rubrerythrin [Eubacteriaceae bacterium]
MKLKGTKTEANLQSAFAGESQALNKYSYYADKAREEGYEQIADIFEETARNEREHAKLWFQFLHDGMPETIENLKDAAAGEHFEYTEMYATMAKEAKEEGFDKIAFLFEAVGKIESGHEERYKALLKNVETKTVFEKEEAEKWQCAKCGYVSEGKKALNCCPVCAAEQSYFQLLTKNY